MSEGDSDRYDDDELEKGAEEEGDEEEEDGGEEKRLASKKRRVAQTNQNHTGATGNPSVEQGRESVQVSKQYGTSTVECMQARVCVRVRVGLCAHEVQVTAIARA